ncbi:hypothetical protein BDB01DRAFT_799388 [Pilobolus umbonatus]|nr:hypothetical protein BDB01DRAFT_799388 [Pilobolus umbonatus]
MSTFSRAQVEGKCGPDSCWVIVNNSVYDITTFLADHPGGDDILLEYGGKDITSVLHDPHYHNHSDAAYDVLSEYYQGELVDKEPLMISTTKSAYKKDVRDEQFLDLRKALFPQLWNATYSKAYYLEMIHKPRHVPYCVPYFDNDVLDLLSKTPWYVVPTLWLPFVVFQLWRSVTEMNGSIEVATKGLMAGILFWSLFEYVLHRFLFHLDDFVPDHWFALLLHFTLHGIHHHMPMDRLRLVMPPALTIILSVPVFSLGHALFYPALAHAFIGGVFFGYICYDMIHYYLHHAKVFKFYFRELKRYHIAHHYKNYNLGFGITSKLWDHVFGTVLYMDNEK